MKTTPKITKIVDLRDKKSPKGTAKAVAKVAKTVKKAVAQSKLVNPCLCGCGEKVKNSFKQGHDARLKGMLLRGEVRNPSAEQKAFAKAHGVKIGANKKAA